MGLEAVGDLALNIILTKLGPTDIAKVACLSKRFRDSASEESLWSKFCLHDLNLSAPLDHRGDAAPSFKACYRLWREAFGMYPWPLVLRVKRCWDGLKSWLAKNFPEAVSTLRKGASEAKIQELENLLGVKVPVPTRLLYRFYDGQDCSAIDSSTSVYGSPLGLIGGYSFYDHFVNVYLLSLKDIMLETREIVPHLPCPNREDYMVVAASSSYAGKFFFLNCSNGQLYVGTRNLVTNGEMLPCVPHELISSVHDFNSDQQQDAMLLWLEEHSHRLDSGIIKVQDEGNFRRICQFPEESPLCSTAVTNGVCIRASAVFVPEAANKLDDYATYLFAYSIRMSLLPDGCILNGKYFNSCQLQWRRWTICANDAVISRVNGEGVIGKYPLLLPGRKEFVYESCTPLSTSSGSVEGSFTFVPGRLADPKGRSFEVEVARFPLQVPSYIF